MRRTGVLLLIAAGLLSAGALAGEPVKGPCVAFPSGTYSGKAVIWWEAPSAGGGGIRYVAGRSGVKAVKSRGQGPRHEVTITGLRPGTEVRYEIGGSGVASAGSFRTPDPKKSFSFAVIGDPRAYDSAAKAMLPLLVADKPDFLIGTGDYVHKGKGNSANWKECFKTLRPILKMAPFFPAIGDHEYGSDEAGEAFRENFVLPGGEFWYSYDWGNCHFIALDVTWGRRVRPGTEQWQWLERDLAAAARSRDLIVAYFHLPVATCGNYSKDPDNTKRGRRLLPLLQKYGVSLVFCGHDHNYQRWEMGGVTQIVSGGFTVQRLYDINRSAQERGRSQGLKFAQKASHYVLVKVDGRKAEVSAIGLQRKIIDRFTVTRR